jgi:PAS domain S-box-containing protein
MAAKKKNARTRSRSGRRLPRPRVSHEQKLVGEETHAMVRDHDGRIRYWGRGAERLYGWSRREALGAISHSLLKTHFPMPLPEIEATIIRDGAWRGEVSHWCKNGTCLEIESHWLLRRAGRQRVIVEFSTDVSARKRAELGHLYHAAIVANSDDAIIGKDLNGIISSWNRGAEAMFGWRAEEIIGKPIQTLFPPDRLEEEDAFLGQLRAGERIDHYETVRRHKNGDDLDVSVTISPIRAPDGAIIGASKIVRDITRQKRADRHLRETQRRSDALLALLDTLLASAPVGFAFIDVERRLVRLNEAMVAIFGLAETDAVGVDVPRAAPAFWAEIGEGYQRALESGRALVNLELPPQAGAPAREARRRMVSFYPVRTRAEIIGVGLIAIDVTEQRRVEEQLRQAQKMEAIGNLTGGMAHDFNNLLGVIIGNLDMLRDQLDEPDTKELAMEALNAALRGADLTQSLLAFARRQPLRPRAIEVNALVGATVKLLSRLLGENIEISFMPGRNVHPVIADRAQLEAALTNLATNARDAMQNGGRLMIATANRYLDEDYAAEHPEVVPGDYAVIEVTDSGTGIAPEVIGRIFDPFFTTKSQAQGSGLGLSMVFGFVKQSGGHVSVYSELGKGTTFRLYLPPADREPAERQTRAEPAGANGGDERILVVEDNAAMRRIAMRQLAGLGYRVLGAENGAAALELLEQESFDLLLSDVVMPGGMSGFELAKIARQRWPDLNILLTSGFPEAKLNGDRSGVDGLRLLSKPYRQEDLALLLREILDAEV